MAAAFDIGDLEKALSIADQVVDRGPSLSFDLLFWPCSPSMLIFNDLPFWILSPLTSIPLSTDCLVTFLEFLMVFVWIVPRKQRTEIDFDVSEQHTQELRRAPWYCRNASNTLWHASSQDSSPQSRPQVSLALPSTLFLDQWVFLSFPFNHIFYASPFLLWSVITLLNSLERPLYYCLALVFLLLFSPCPFFQPQRKPWVFVTTRSIAHRAIKK